MAKDINKPDPVETPVIEAKKPVVPAVIVPPSQPPAVMFAAEPPRKSFNVTVPGESPRVVIADCVEDVVRAINGASGVGKGGVVHTAKQLKITEVI